MKKKTKDFEAEGSPRFIKELEGIFVRHRLKRVEKAVGIKNGRKG